MAKEDDVYRKTLNGMPTGDRGTDYMNAVIERDKRARERQNMYTPAHDPAPLPKPGPVFPETPRQGQRGRSYPVATAPVPHMPAAPETLTTMAKNGALLFALLFVGYTLLQDYWTWPKMIGGSLGFALAGAVAGAALFVALKILALATKIGFYLLIAGFVLHVLGIVNMWNVLARIGHALGF